MDNMRTGELPCCVTLNVRFINTHFDIQAESNLLCKNLDHVLLLMSLTGLLYCVRKVAL